MCNVDVLPKLYFHKHAHCEKVKVLVAQLCLTLCNPMDQAPKSMGFSRQEYWSGLPFPSPRNLRNPGIEPMSPTLQADSLPSESPEKASCCILEMVQ